MTDNPFSHRWYLFTIRFFIAFLALITIWVLLVANGYHILTAPFRIVKIGLISFTAHPSDPQVFLNGKARTSGRHLIDNLPPGRYTLRLQKEGYYSWEITTDVHAGEAVVYDDIVLFYTEPRRLPISDPLEQERYQKLLENPDRFQAGLQVLDREIWAEEQFVTRYDQPIEQALWYPGKTHILVLVGKELHLIEATGVHDIVLQTFPTASNSIRFAPASGGQFIVIQSGDQLELLEITAPRPLIDLPTFQQEQSTLN
ncbi:carboxypeptidase regulatory-like domain-containing protein [Candidatus Berkelbacteria bacterium]|nr:carboxypeptidase regulatory-like domain-containing protein [Candidatus Berkelbacteria bacterium]